MRKAQHAKTGSKRRIWTRLGVISSTCVAAALVFALGLGTITMGALPGSTMADMTSPTTGTESTSHEPGTIPASDGTEPAAEAAQAPASSYASLPEEDYTANTVIISVDGEQDIEAATTQLDALESMSNVSVDTSDASSGFVKVTYEGDASAGEVADLLHAQGLEAQPNFRYYALALDNAEENVTAADDADSPLTPQATQVNDPERGEQWGLSVIRAYDAWDIAKGKASPASPRPVSVAIIDSGCMVDHPDLQNNLVGRYDTRTGGTDVTDDQNHGTPVAGIISAEANNGIGVAGVSYNAGLYIVRALHKQGNEFVAESTDILKAYDNVVANKKIGDTKIRVINMSLGSKRTGTLGEKDTAVIRKIDEAYATHDILTVSAAGNKDGTVPYRCYPCDFSDNVIGVINLEKKDNGSIVRNEDSNYNMPGTQAKQLSAPGTRIYTTANNGRYVTKTGTSMAAPCVSGVAALAFVANPQLSAASVKNILCSAADDINTPGFDSFTGYGKVNALTTVQMAKGVADVTGPDSVYIGRSISLNCPAASDWSSSNTSVATVTDTGLVRGVKAGYTTISVKSNGRTLKKSIAVYDGRITGPGTIQSGYAAQYKVECSIDGAWNFELGANTANATITKDGKLTANQVGQVTIVAKLNSNPNISVELPITVQQGPVINNGGDDNPGAPGTKIMFRLYNPNSGEHFYTASVVERDHLISVGWNYEGEGWTAPESSSAPVFRLYNANAGDHHYTTSAVERDHLISVGWNDEGIGWYSDIDQGVPLYRQYNPNAVAGSHNYTTSTVERDHLISVGWNDEGIGWYGL